jgi:autotransporter-associated beta strand protein
MTLSNNISVNNTTYFSPQGNTVLTLSGVISGAGQFTINAFDTGSTILLTGANSYAGGTVLGTGTLKLGNATALGASDGLSTGVVQILGNGTALDLNGYGTSTAITNPLILNGTGISSGGALLNSSSTGAVYAGLVSLSASASIVGGTGSITLSNSGTIGGSGFGLTLGGAQGGSIASIIGTGAGGLTKQDTGTWTLSGANTYSGGTTITSGTLKFGTSYLTTASAVTSSPIGTSNVTIGAGGTLDLNGYNFGASTQTSVSLFASRHHNEVVVS